MQVIDKFIENDGILAACAGQRGVLEFAYPSTTVTADRERWGAMFAHLITLLDLIPDDEIKVVVNEHTLVFRRQDVTYVGVVVIKGHPVVKSVQRMVRALFRKLGSPVPSPRDARAARIRQENAAAPAAPPVAPSTAPVTPPPVVADEDDFGPRF